MVFVFHAVKSLIDSICMDLQSTKVIFFAFWSASMGDYNSNRIIMIENTMNKIKKMIAVSSHLLVWRWQNVFSSSSNAGLFIFYLRIQGCRPTHPPSQHPALIHFQQILHRLTCSRTSWGFVTVPGWELIRWTPRGVCIFKPKGFRYQSNCPLRWTGRHTHVGSLHGHSLWRRAATGERCHWAMSPTWRDLRRDWRISSVWQMAGWSITQAPHSQRNEERYGYLSNKDRLIHQILPFQMSGT